MKHLLSTSLILTFISTFGFAADPVSLGQKSFKKCTACHAIIDDNGEVLRKGGKAGPNLYGIIGRTAGSAEFRYSKALKAAGAGGLVWDEVELAVLDDKKARSKMAYKMKKGGSDVAAYLKSMSE